MLDVDSDPVLTLQGADAMPAGLWKGPSALTLGMFISKHSISRESTDEACTVRDMLFNSLQIS